MPAEVHLLISNQGINVVIGSSMTISVSGKEKSLDWPNSGELSSYNRTLF
ncbi:hypothetical protein [Lysinibacillus capsici]|nr:hypothetical protein [Lysinibacillus capsici]